MSIFKAYDIRGTVPDELDETMARDIGRCFRTVLGEDAGDSPVIVVGQDMRVSSPALSAALVEGLNETGCDVIHVGMVSTPMLNYAVASGGHAGGIMVTASHNPGAYNGFKLCRRGGVPISGQSGIQDIREWVENRADSFQPASRMGRSTKQDIFGEYSNFILSLVELGERPLRLVADAANGVTGVREYLILEKLYPGIEGMYLEPDGDFPNHEANPLVVENTRALADRVKGREADAGIAFDGDGDRVVILDGNGEPVGGDMLTALIARRELAEKPGSVVLYDLRSSRAVAEEIRAAGGIPKKCRVGHAFIKQMMREDDAVFAGELSGHFYFKDAYFLDVGILAALKVLELLSNSEQSLEDMIKPLQRYRQSGEINHRVSDPDGIIERVVSDFEKEGEVSYLDGLSVDFEDWWFNLRKSNTEPLLRLNVEAATDQLLEEKLERLSGYFEN